MAKLIRQSEALRRINELEEQAVAAGNLAGCEWLLKCWIAIMNCPVERSESEVFDLSELRMAAAKLGLREQAEGRRDPETQGMYPLRDPLHNDGESGTDAQGPEEDCQEDEPLPGQMNVDDFLQH